MIIDTTSFNYGDHNTLKEKIEILNLIDSTLLDGFQLSVKGQVTGPAVFELRGSGAERFCGDLTDVNRATFYEYRNMERTERVHDLSDLKNLMISATLEFDITQEETRDVVRWIQKVDFGNHEMGVVDAIVKIIPRRCASIKIVGGGMTAKIEMSCKFIFFGLYDGSDPLCSFTLNPSDLFRLNRENNRVIDELFHGWLLHLKDLS